MLALLVTLGNVGLILTSIFFSNLIYIFFLQCDLINSKLFVVLTHVLCFFILTPGLENARGFLTVNLWLWYVKRYLAVRRSDWSVRDVY